MKYLLDSDWIVDYLNGQPRAIEFLAPLAPNGAAISVMTYGEIWDGLELTPPSHLAVLTFERLLDSVLVLDLTRDELRTFARLRNGLRRSGQLIGDADLLIAATALRYDLTLVTRNWRHFTRVPGLRLYENEE